MKPALLIEGWLARNISAPAHIAIRVPRRSKRPNCRLETDYNCVRSAMNSLILAHKERASAPLKDPRIQRKTI
jgi:hypothetical protein